MQYTVIDEHILNIVQNREIKEQSELQGVLEERGFNIPQATLSRRLKKLNVVKVSGIYKTIHTKQNNLPTVLNMQISESGLIVLHTHPGQASSLAYFLDRKYVSYSIQNIRNSGILGTIAGDDTVMLILKSNVDIPHVRSLLLQDFSYVFMK